MNADVTLLIFAMKTNTICNLDKYDLQFVTNTLYNYALHVMLMFEKMNASVVLLIFAMKTNVI